MRHLVTILAVILSVALESCKKEGDQIPKGPDVYIAGYQFNGSKEVAMYWKNGVATALTKGVTSARAMAIEVVGNDVFIAGYERVGDNIVPVYWKNGIQTNLPSKDDVAYATSIAVVGQDIYIGGHQYSAPGYQTAVYWKNGVANELTDGKNKSSTSSISVVGNDVYISGSEVTGTNSRARVWKNGVPLPLNIDSDESYGVELAVSGADVYLAGFENVAGTFSARYWKNAEATVLPDGKHISQARQSLFRVQMSTARAMTTRGPKTSLRTGRTACQLTLPTVSTTHLRWRSQSKEATPILSAGNTRNLTTSLSCGRIGKGLFFQIDQC